MVCYSFHVRGLFSILPLLFPFIYKRVPHFSLSYGLYGYVSPSRVFPRFEFFLEKLHRIPKQYGIIKDIPFNTIRNCALKLMTMIPLLPTFL